MKRKEEERRKRKEQMDRIQKEREKQALEAAEEDSFIPQERDLLRQKREDDMEVEREFERLSVVAVFSASLMPFYISWLANNCVLVSKVSAREDRHRSCSSRGSFGRTR